MTKEKLLFGDSLCHAFIVLQASNYVHLDDEMCREQLIAPHNQEMIVIRKDLYESLSDEAKFVIALIFKAPAEVIEELQQIKLPGYQNYKNGIKSTKPTVVFKKERIACYLRKKWGKRILVKQVINELETYAKELGRI